MSNLISVIIPVYNTESELPLCLESVCAQTYKNLEILLVDDGSTDASGRICNEFAERDPRIKVVHQANAGVSAARNSGLAICTGDMIAFADSDDWFDPSLIDELHYCLVANRADVSICGSIEYPNGTPVEKGSFIVPPCGFRDAAFQMMRKDGFPASVWGKLFARDTVFSGN